MGYNRQQWKRARHIVVCGWAGAFNTLNIYSESFTYDPVNRLAGASETSANCGGTYWQRNFSYDQWGNQWVSNNGGLTVAGDTPQSYMYDWSTNRRTDRSYDGAGNQTLANGDTLAYDAENRLTTVIEPAWQGGLTLTYTYDGEGRRVKKSGGTSFSRIVYAYDAFGQLAAKYVDAGAPAVACQTCYLSYDHLGSTRVVTDQSGQVVARHDYLPFGEEIQPPDGGRSAGQSGIGTFGAADGVYQRFTGQVRDSETGLDFFESRYFGGALGRFTSPDEPFAGQDPTDPQSWNLYAYVVNNPIRYTDPDGHDDEDNSSGVPTFRATGTGYSGLAPWEEFLYRSLFQGVSQMMQLGQQTQQVAQQTFDWLGAPRDPGCMQKAALLGAGAGAAIGGVAGALGGGAAGGIVGSIIPVAGTAAGAAGGGTLGFAGGASIGGAIGYGGGLAIGFAACMSSTGTGGGGGSAGPSPGARKKLGNLANRAGEKVRDVIRSRGGTASNVNQVGPWADKTLGEAAQAAANGDPTAETAIKIAKQAGRLGQQY